MGGREEKSRKVCVARLASVFVRDVDERRDGSSENGERASASGTESEERRERGRDARFIHDAPDTAAILYRLQCIDRLRQQPTFYVVSE